MNLTDKQVGRIGVAGGLGSLGAGLAGAFTGGGNNPYDAAGQYYNQIPDIAKQYFNPYIGAGQDALGQMQNQYGGLINDPNAVLNRIGKGYQQSPGYDWQMNQAMQAGNNAAAAGGMLGSPAHQQQNMEVAQGLANQDYYNYLQHALGLYGIGTQGLQGIGQMGYGASGDLAGLLSTALMNQGNLAYSGAAAQNQQKGSQWGDIFGGLGSILGFAGLL